MKPTPEQIDAILPQTQCGLCTYGGCMPYAEALVFENAPINLCPPGGVTTLKKIGELKETDPAPFIADMETKTKPKMLAVIREAECIGCVKCIQACPVDAILGSAKQMHTVIGEECTGCELCVSPCPVDCIDMITIDDSTPSNKADHYRNRHLARQTRLKLETSDKNQRKQQNSTLEKKRYIQDAIARSKAKKINSTQI